GYDDYLWSTGETTSSILIDSSDTNYGIIAEIWGRVTNFDGCSSSDTINVGFIFYPVIFDSLWVCNGDSIMIYGEFQFLEGEYYDTISSSIGIDSVICTYLSIYSLPEVFIGLDTTISMSESVVLNPITDGISFLWSNGATSNSLVVDSSFIDVENSAEVWLEVSNSMGCVTFDTIQIFFTVGIYDVFQDMIKVYPNPGEGIVNIESNFPMSEIRVFNIITQEKMRISNPGQDVRLDLSDLPAGAYIFKISSLNTSYSKKIIINRRN
ncbi:MAG: T9SS type A sorting domain-containing protein, partial [Bacteroidales bacterium]|nr:T9SS type A sorting domain-containing protein [Bacteroidales bacterium]